MENKKYKVLVVGCGNMGGPHAKAYHKINAFEIVGMVTRHPENYRKLHEELGGQLTWFTDFHEALEKTKPDIVSVNTYPDTHVEFVQRSLESGAHVFVEKPLAPTVEDAIKLVELSKKSQQEITGGLYIKGSSGLA